MHGPHAAPCSTTMRRVQHLDRSHDTPSDPYAEVPASSQAPGGFQAASSQVLGSNQPAFRPVGGVTAQMPVDYGDLGDDWLGDGGERGAA